VTIRDLLRATLRHRPDRIIVGEVRGGEAYLPKSKQGTSPRPKRERLACTKCGLRSFTEAVTSSG
jgi:hypothetical protein